MSMGKNIQTPCAPCMALPCHSFPMRHGKYPTSCPNICTLRILQLTSALQALSAAGAFVPFNTTFWNTLDTASLAC